MICAPLAAAISVRLTSLARVRGVSKITEAACTTAARTMGLAMDHYPLEILSQAATRQLCKVCTISALPAAQWLEDDGWPAAGYKAAQPAPSACLHGYRARSGDVARSASVKHERVRRVHALTHPR